MNAPLNMKEAAVALHEMFISLIEAGFTSGQALALVASMVKGSVAQ